MIIITIWDKKKIRSYFLEALFKTNLNSVSSDVLSKISTEPIDRFAVKIPSD